MHVSSKTGAGRPGDQLHTRRVREVDLVHDQRAVAVEEEGPVHGARETWSRSSSGVTVAVPSFATTTPAAAFAKCAASSRPAPDVSARTRPARAVSPAPETS